ncbi:hypothetical protein [Methanonatronarchaeum sp. AMET6-2]|uniref:hypothetical protein n=1 Tax=Methanonatronarchaeum sp. AMET6-2 TaxID=2933293 RepID=UPI001FF30ABA|nr:hypothetical protein [Methanonatronarchaeum sp. AMET6-2]UOY10005.1 hypothetical protein MU439_07030 [Methanonatronarchaeum sp. AMET6-2]
MNRDTEKIIWWYEKEGREFPWRETENPYEVLIAEAMLQKTSASQVLPIYRDFLKRYPSPNELAGADVDEISDIIYSLGLQNTRARRFKKLGKKIVDAHAGEIPSKKEQLMDLPGIGEYISNAVLTLVFEEERPMVDANVIRVVGRAYYGDGDRKTYEPEIEEKVMSLMPPKKAREFNLALIDLGALVCRPKNPSCRDCPLIDSCMYTGLDD